MHFEPSTAKGAIWSRLQSLSCDLKRLLPLPKQAPHEIWHWAAKRFLRFFENCDRSTDGT